MNVAIISRANYDSKNFYGIFKKLSGEAGAFNSLGYNAVIYYRNSRGIVEYDLKKKKIVAVLPSNSVLCFFVFYSRLYHYLKTKKIKIIWIRFAKILTPFLIRFYKRFKRHNCINIIEMPTYPYDQEYIGFKNKIKLLFDKCYRSKLRKYVNFIVTSDKYDTIYGVNVLQLHNGIDLSIIPERKVIGYKTDTLRLLTVANYSTWHGIDRLIEGLYHYYKANNSNISIHLTMVGDGVELDNLKSMVSKYDLAKYCTFYGPAIGPELDKLFTCADIGIGSLGLHRIGLRNGNTLKAREFCARGLPFVVGHNEQDFPESFPYICTIPANDSFVDVEEIIAFYNRVSSISLYRKDMRKYSEHNLTWIAQMKKIIHNFSRDEV